MGIAKGLGKPVRVDTTTLNFERARYARVCVEVNLKRPLKGTVMINGERYFVSYEGLSSICSLCGIFGHSVHTCSKRVQGSVNPPATQVSPMYESGNGAVPAEEGFTQVRRGRRKPMEEVDQNRIGKQAHELRKNKDLSIITLENSFGNLEENMEPGEIREVSDTNVVNGAKEVREIQGLMKNNGGGTGKENINPACGIEQRTGGERSNGLVFGTGSGQAQSSSRVGLRSQRHGNG